MKEEGSFSMISVAPLNPTNVPFDTKYSLASSMLIPSGLWMAELYSQMVVIIAPSCEKNLAAQYPTFPNP